MRPRRFLAAATVTLAGAALCAGPAHAAQSSASPPTRQQVFAQAAKEYKVPEGLLLAVSYLESRWDAHQGEPSTSAGFGPMHLIDGALAQRSAQAAEDSRGDTSRPALKPTTANDAVKVPQTLAEAARLTKTSPATLRTDPSANIRAGAALLAEYRHQTSGWADAVARYGDGSRWFAGQVYDVLRTGASRTTDDGQQVTLKASPGTETVRAKAGKETECPPGLDCEWIPAPYVQYDPSDPNGYGNHDLADRPHSQKITYIVIHDTEGYYPNDIKDAQDPKGVSWNYTVRSADGHVAQHVKTKDVAWQAGNWYVNSKSIGIEHEGFLAQGGTWFTEAMYRSSSQLVRYLTAKYHIPLDRAHILGHDNVPGTIPSTVQDMHEDPGPYWDWVHYFNLLRAPLHGNGGHGEVMIKPNFRTNVVPYTGCDAKNPAAPCPVRGGGSIMLRTAPNDTAPLVKDIGKHPPNGDATMSVYDHSARAATGQKYAVADRAPGWTAIWYLGQKAWFHSRDAVPAHGLVVTAKKGATSVPVYGRAYPEAAAYPTGVPVQDLTPMQYVFAAGQRYAIGGTAAAEYYYAKTINVADHVVVRDHTRYYEIQFGHRVYYVKAADVRVRAS